MVHHGAEVNDRTLKGGHNGATYDGHYEECCAERSVLCFYVFKGDAVNGGEHERHERRNAYKAIKTGHAYEDYCTRCAEHGADAEDGEQATRVDVLHQEGRDKATAKEHAHGENVVVLCRSLVDAKVVGVLDDERPYHNLCRNVEHLCHNSLTINRVMPQALESY